MGSTSSKEQKNLSFKEQIKNSVQEEINRKMMQQRELNMALNIAKARDSLQIFGSLYATFVSGLTVAKIAGKSVPTLAGVPVVIGAVLLGNIADMAYGNKLGRVCQETEHILEHERPRFVPFKQAPFAKFYSKEEKEIFFDQSTAVGNLFPSSLFARQFALGSKP